MTFGSMGHDLINANLLVMCVGVTCFVFVVTGVCLCAADRTLTSNH